MSNLEARALAAILTERYDDGYNRLTGEERDLAAQARAGGRALTESIAHFAGPAISREMMAEDPAKTWHYHIDPSGAYGWADPRREAEARERWQSIAEDGAYGLGDWSQPKHRVTLTTEQAEAMLDWPIYREAIENGVIVR